MDYLKLNKFISYILRHKADEYNLKLSQEGWVQIGELLEVINKTPEWENVTEADLRTLVNMFDKIRFEIDGSYIRALYGHSTEKKIEMVDVAPPDVLFHGTPLSSSEKILLVGLLPMSRQYTHLSVNMKIAMEVALRRSKDYVIFKIDAKRAYHDGIRFHKGNNDIWLTDFIPPQYLSVEEK